VLHFRIERGNCVVVSILKNISPERFLQKADADTVFFLFPHKL
jgi:hypothetical protein